MSRKFNGFELWEKVFKKAKYIAAPMVDQSELAWRVLMRKYGAELCYTPMYHARLFQDPVNDKYRRDIHSTNKQDRPLIVQFCANDPDTLLRAALLIQDECDAVDLNLGCPQGIARKGRYGSFLQDEWELIGKMVSLLHEKLSIPVTCKIRVFPDPEKTVRYAKMLQEAGCQLLTVHGRVREQKGHHTGLADWEQIKNVKKALNIPVFANGNILYFEDVEKCIQETGVDGVMSAEGLLYNPALFSGKQVKSYEIASEYLDICKEIPTGPNIIRAHLFKLLHKSLPLHTDLRAELGKVRNLSEFESLVKKLKERIEPNIIEEVNNDKGWSVDILTGLRVLPHWICQPYVRPALPDNEHHAKKSKKQKVCPSGEATKDDDKENKI